MKERWAVVVSLLATFAALTLWSASRESATYDEVPHIGGGLSHVVTGDRRHDLGGEPPLPKLLAGWAAAAAAPRLPLDDPAWRGCNPEATCRFSTRLLYGEGGGSSRILMRARLPFVGLGLVLAAAVYFWTRERFGRAAAGFALFLAAFNPEMLAHAHYAGSDLPMTLVATLLFWGASRFAARPTPRFALWVSGAVAGAVVTKFSFPAVFMMAAALFGVELVLLPRVERGPRLRALFPLVIGAAAVAYAAIWAAYGFRARAAGAGDLTCDMTIETLLPRPSPARWFLQAARDQALLPEAYATGLALRVNETDGRRPSYLNGVTTRGGHPLYFPIALALKTPVPLLLLAVLWAGIADRSTRGRCLALLIAVALYLVLAMRTSFNIGYRHLQPVLPILCIVGGAALAWLWSWRGGRVVASLLLAWYALGTLRVAPHFLSYFNELAGGPLAGSRFLADSNLDWGQDLDELARVARERGFERIKLSYFGNASPEAAGVPLEAALPSVTTCWQPAVWASAIREGDVVAISVNNLRLVYMGELDGYPTPVDLPGLRATIGFPRAVRWIEKRYRPAAYAGYSIWIYRLTPEYQREAPRPRGRCRSPYRTLPRRANRTATLAARRSARPGGGRAQAAARAPAARARGGRALGRRSAHARHQRRAGEQDLARVEHSTGVPRSAGQREEDRRPELQRSWASGGRRAPRTAPGRRVPEASGVETAYSAASGGPAARARSSLLTLAGSNFAAAASICSRHWSKPRVAPRRKRSGLKRATRKALRYGFWWPRFFKASTCAPTTSSRASSRAARASRVFIDPASGSARKASTLRSTAW